MKISRTNPAGVERGTPENRKTEAQNAVFARDAVGEKLRKARALADVLANCRAEQLDDESVPCVALMLAEIVEGLEAEFDEVAEAKRGDTESR